MAEDRKCGLNTAQLARLEHACRVVWDAFDGHTYLVGTAGDSPVFRDVDVRTILADHEFDALFGQAFERRSVWSLLCHTVTEYLTSVSGLPVDFQVQRQSEANTKYKGRPRNPIGMGAREFAGLGDATKFTVDPPLCGFPVRTGDWVHGCESPVERRGLCESHASLQDRWDAEAAELGGQLAEALRNNPAKLREGE